jgi:hypothetical protein
MVPLIDLDAIPEQRSESRPIFSSNRVEQSLGVTNVDKLAPFTKVDGIEASRDALTTWVLLDEPNKSSNWMPDVETRADIRNATSNTMLVLLLLQPFLLVISRFGTILYP